MFFFKLLYLSTKNIKVEFSVQKQHVVLQLVLCTLYLFIFIHNTPYSAEIVR